MAEDAELRRGFEFGPFTVIPERGIVRRDGADVHLEPKQMDALVTLARHQPGVVGKDVLVEEVWGGRATADESIVQCIKGIRQALDKDDPRNPKYIETIQRRGYRLMVPLKIPVPDLPESAGMRIPRTWWLAGSAAVIGLAVIAIRVMSGGGIEQQTAVPVGSVVVMRFQNLSRDEYREENQWVVDGFAEQLISTLYEVPKLRTLKGNLPVQDEAASEQADRYGVDSVVNGNVQQLDDDFTIRVTVYAEDTANQCGKSFSGTLQEMFDLHEKVATTVRDCIVGTSTVTVSPTSQPSGSISYLRYLRGASYLARRDLASLERASELLNESIQIDPAYGPAFLALANTYLLLADYGAREDLFALAEQTIADGIRLDPSIGEAAQTYRGYVQTKRGQWTAATESFATAVSSSVDHPPTLHYYSRLLATVGRTDDSLAAAKAAWEMDREEPVLNSRLAIAHMWNNDMEQARQFYAVANAMDLGAPIHLMSYALFLIRDSRINEAREVARAAMMLYEIDTSWVDPVFNALEQGSTSASFIAVLDDYAARNVMQPAVLVTFRTMAGQADLAMKIAWQLIDDASYFDLELIYLDEFRLIRQHQDFPRLLDELGLTEYWSSVGCRWSRNDDQVVCGSN